MRANRGQPMERPLSPGKARDRALVLPVVGVFLLLPPVAQMFHLDVRVLSVPFTALYLFGVWALLTVLVLPMLVPVLVFGARATSLAAADLSPAAGLYWLAALATLSVCLGPFALAAAVRASIE